MTKSICISVDVRHLSESSRRIVPEHIGSGVPYVRQPSKHRSHVTVALDVPKALVGDHLEYGTSVFAAGHAALEYARAELARAGLRKEELDQLTAAQVSILSVTVTYLLRFTRRAETLAFAKAMTYHATLLGLRIFFDPVAWTVEYRGQLPAKGPSVADTASQSSNEVVLTRVSRPCKKLVRLELKLDSDYLRVRGWSALDSWRRAYAEKRYEAIFNANVRGLFRLDVDCRYDPPGPKVYAGLSTFAEEVLRQYLAGRNPETCRRFPPGVQQGRANKRALKNHREQILAVSGIDINIPWVGFQRQRPPLLVNKLTYPGDYHPSAKYAPQRFCKENWPKLLQDLRAAYEAALAAGSAL